MVAGWGSLPANLRLMAATFEGPGVDAVSPELVAKVRAQMNEQWPLGPERASARPRERVNERTTDEELRIAIAAATAAFSALERSWRKHIVRNR